MVEKSKAANTEPRCQNLNLIPLSFPSFFESSQCIPHSDACASCLNRFDLSVSVHKMESEQ